MVISDYHCFIACLVFFIGFMLHVLLAMCTIVSFSMFLMCVCRILINIIYLLTYFPHTYVRRTNYSLLNKYLT